MYVSWGEVGCSREKAFSVTAENEAAPERANVPSEWMTVMMRQHAVRARSLTASQRNQATEPVQTLHAPLHSLPRGQPNHFSYVPNRTTHRLYI